MSIRGIAFDIDGTLADTVPVCLTALRRTFLQYTGRRYSDNELKALFTPTEEGIVRQVIPDQCPDAVDTFFREYEAAHENCTAPFAGIHEILSELRRRDVRLAALTGKGPTTAAMSLGRIGLSDFFETVLTGSETGVVKSRRLRELSALWDIEPSALAYVGDTASDIDQARDAGAVPLSAGWAASTDVRSLEEAGPHALFRTTDEMLDWVRSGAVSGSP